MIAFKLYEKFKKSQASIAQLTFNNKFRKRMREMKNAPSWKLEAFRDSGIEEAVTGLTR